MTKRLFVRVQDEEAQGVLEFFFVTTILVLLFLGTVDFARFAYYDTAVVNAARIAAETGGNHCIETADCGISDTAQTDDVIMWTAYCESAPYVQFYPQYTSCTASDTSGWQPTCSGTCTNCAQDVCITKPSTTDPTPTDETDYQTYLKSTCDTTSTNDRSVFDKFCVTVGYRFQPLTFLMDQFFPEISCYSGDTTSTNHHTLCSTSDGRVSS